MKNIIAHIVFCIIALGLASCKINHSSGVKPNVVLVLTDDQGWGDVGYNGNEIIDTPTLDSLADNAVVFNRFYVSPVCAPTRASLLTGKYNLSTGVTWVTHRKEVMRESEITIAEILKENGYKTACFGKWHNGQQYPHNANGQGFDTFFGFSAGHWNNYFDTNLEYNGQMVNTKGYIADVITDSVVSFIKGSKEPFFAYVAYNTPHTPYQVSDEYFEKYRGKNLDDKTAAIYGMCENIDDNLARIQAALHEAEKHSNTIFIYLSDNGPNYVRYNGGYKGRKAQVDEGGVRVPFIIDYPEGNFKERTVNNQFAAHIDLLPTLLDLCNISKQGLTYDGVSFAGVLTDTAYKMPDRMFFSHQVFDSSSFTASVRTNNYLLTCYPSDTSLFDISIDPYQMHNLLGKEGEIAQELKGNLHVWLNKNNYQKIESEPIIMGYAEAPFIEFPAHECSKLHNVNFAEGMGWANDYITKWDDSDDRIAWSVKVLNTDKYMAKLQYVCSSEDIGSNFSLQYDKTAVDFKIDKACVKQYKQSPDRVKRVEAYEVNWAEQLIGEIALNEEVSALNLVYNDNRHSNIEIKGILLERIKK